jgi:hypothetical protein
MRTKRCGSNFALGGGHGLAQQVTQMYDGLWDGMYFLLLIGFAIGNSVLGSALIKGLGLTRVIGVWLWRASDENGALPGMLADEIATASPATRHG